MLFADCWLWFAVCCLSFVCWSLVVVRWLFDVGCVLMVVVGCCLTFIFVIV